MPSSDAALERTAVRLSFWFGGWGLTLMKGAAYVATGSVLVRTSMFESIGDVITSAIMAITQMKMNHSHDAHQYPVGKGRFQALGVLFFCAFMCSSMSSMAIDSLQALASTEDEGPAPADAALRRLFDEKPRLRWAYGGNVDSLIQQYGSSGDNDKKVDNVSLVLLFVCAVVKAMLFFFCRGVERRKASDIVAALGDDHRNDTLSVTLVLGVMGFVAYSEHHGWESPLLDKLEPGVSLLLSVWIVYGWVTNALEQLKALSDTRADEDAVDVKAIRAAAEGALKGSALHVQGANAYHSGEGFRVQIQLSPAGKTNESIVEFIAALENAVHGVSEEIRMVDVTFRAPSASSSGLAKDYAAAVGA